MAFGNHASGARLHSSTPATEARSTPLSPRVSSPIFSSADRGAAAPSALSSGFQNSSSSVRKPVSGTGCSSNRRKRACPRRCARRRRSSPVITRFELPTRWKLPPGLSCCAWPRGTSTSTNGRPSSSSRRKMPGRTGGRMASVQTSTSSRSNSSICARDIPCTSPASVTPHSSTPPSVLAKAAISSARSSRRGPRG